MFDRGFITFLTEEFRHLSLILNIFVAYIHWIKEVFFSQPLSTHPYSPLTVPFSLSHSILSLLLFSFCCTSHILNLAIGSLLLHLLMLCNCQLKLMSTCQSQLISTEPWQSKALNGGKRRKKVRKRVREKHKKESWEGVEGSESIIVNALVFSVKGFTA